MTEIIDLTAGEIAAAVAGGRLTAEAVMTACLDRVAAVNGAVNAICTLNPNALEAALAVDRRLANGAVARPLEGVPLLVKDNIETKGLLTTFGSNLMRDHLPDFDAIAVERLKAAGAIVIGKTNTPAFAADINTTNDLFGYTRNPWDLGVTPGGSSGGTGAGLAAGMAPIGLGTDLGGSVRVPAAHNGVVGLRPSQGRVPVWSAEFAWDTLVAHVHGPMARCVSDVGLMLQAMAGPDDRDPLSLPTEGADYARAARGGASMGGRRIAVSYDLNGILPLDPEVRDLATAAVRRLVSLGFDAREDFFDVSDLMTIISGTRAFNMVARHADRYDHFADRMPVALRNQVSGALTTSLRTATQAERGRTAYWHRVRTLLTEYDYIVTPAVGAPPFVSMPHCRRKLAAKRSTVTTTRFCPFMPSALPACRRLSCLAASRRTACRWVCKSSDAGIVTIPFWKRPPSTPRFPRIVSVGPKSISRLWCRCSPGSRRLG